MIRTLTICAGILAMCAMMLSQSVEIPRPAPPDIGPRDILLADHLHGHWLTVGRINHKDPRGEFDPCFTYIVTEPGLGIIPVVKKRGNFYQITFTSEIAKDLP